MNTADVNKRYYWLKLPDDFFRQKEIKQLRRIAGGDTFTIIYLKMLLRSLKDGGKLYFEGIDDNFESELALDIDEDEDNVKVTVSFLMAHGILIRCSDEEYELLTAGYMTGSEGYSAERVRRFRQKAQLALQCNTAVTASNEEIEKRDRDRNRDREKKSMKRERFTPPTAEEVKAYATEKGYTLDAERFVDFYASKGWMVGKSPMKDWKAAVRNWASRKDEPAREAWHNPALDYSQRDYSGTQKKPERVYWSMDDMEG